MSEVERSAASSLVRLGIVLAAIVAAFLALGLSDLLVFLVALLLFVIVHELGHYAVAKWSHMKVTEYFIGFGPKLWSVRRGETEYGIKPFLLGAYVKIPGMTNLEQVDPADEPRTYRRQPFHRRIAVAVAGIVMHFVMALVLALVLVFAFGVPSSSRVDVVGFVHWHGHARNAAQTGGIRVGDAVLSVAGRAVTTPAALASEIQASRGKPVAVVVTRHGRHETLSVAPRLGHTTPTAHEVLGGGPKSEWLVGVVTAPTVVFARQGPLRGASWAARELADVTRLTVVGIGRVFSPGGLHTLYTQVTSPRTAKSAARGPTASNRIVSIVGFSRVATEAERAGPYYFISILIALNVALGLLNLLPMLPLDGGHVVIALYERVRTRRGRPYYQADVAKLLPVVYAFIGALVLVIGSAVFLDIAHPIANPFG